MYEKPNCNVFGVGGICLGAGKGGEEEKHMLNVVFEREMPWRKMMKDELII